MYRKLCEEQQKTRSSIENISSNLQGSICYSYVDFSLDGHAVVMEVV